MFHDIPLEILNRMRELEAIDARDRVDGTPKPKRLRQITPETGRFIALMAAGTPEGIWIELGTSAGYSTLWLALACIKTGHAITTFEILSEKVRLAGETFRLAKVEDIVRLIEGDAREYLEQYEGISFCFLDADKRYYGKLYELIVPRLVQGGLLLADNAISHAEELADMLAAAEADQRVDSLVVPIGRGVLTCRKI